MAWTQVCCQYDGSFAGFLTCVFNCYVNREEPAEFRTLEEACCSLYPLRTIQTREEQAQRVYHSLSAKLGREGHRLVTLGYLTCLPDREMWLWRFLRRGYQVGPKITQDLADPTVNQLYKAVLHLKQEAHLFTGFTRFSDLEGVLVGEIQPKNRVLPLLRPHFCTRFPQEQFILYDQTHHEVLVYRPGQWVILPAEDFQRGRADERELAYRRMWRTFYDTIAIEGRYNPKCRMTHMPKRYWDNMTEFQRDETALPQKTGAGHG